VDQFSGESSPVILHLDDREVGLVSSPYLTPSFPYFFGVFQKLLEIWTYMWFELPSCGFVALTSGFGYLKHDINFIYMPVYILSSILIFGV
jgi:hypothetical protein